MICAEQTASANSMVQESARAKLRALIESRIKSSDFKNSIELEQAKKEIQTLLEAHFASGSRGEIGRAEALGMLDSVVADRALDLPTDGALSEILDNAVSPQRNAQSATSVSDENPSIIPALQNDLTRWAPIAALTAFLVILCAGVVASPAASDHDGSVLSFLGYTTSATVESQVDFLAVTQGALRAFSQKLKVYPVSKGKFTPISNVFKFMNLKGVATPELNDTVSEKLMYRSDGLSFKLVYIGSGLCSNVKTAKPSLIDPARSFNNKDCFGYGVWTSKAQSW